MGDAWWAGREGFTFVHRAVVADACRAEDCLALLRDEPGIVVDTTTAADTGSLLLEAVRAGHSVVLANDEPLLASPALFRTLTADGRTRYEATVAPGLPVISTLRDLIDTGDFVSAVTLGLGGAPAAVLEATERGTPIDGAMPDGDASARAATIVARTLGYDIRLEMVARSPLGGAFDASPAGARGASGPSRRRYLAVVEGSRARVAPMLVPAASALAEASAHHQIACFETARFADAPLVLRGPRPSAERVAAALLRDLLTLAREGDRPWRAERRARAKEPAVT